MAIRKDILLDGDNDLLIENGDLVIGVSDDQNVKLLVEFHPGELKEWPLAGFGASRYLKKTTFFVPKLLRNLKVQLEYDGYSNSEITFNDKGGLNIDIG